MAIGATDVQFPRKSLIHFKLFFLSICFFFFQAQAAFALVEKKPIHFSGDKQIWNRKENIVELFGHAVVNQPGETLNADYIKLYLNQRSLDAKGECVYIVNNSVIWGEEMHFNLDTRTGIILKGKVSNERFSLSGEKINRLGVGRFQTHWGTYTTCFDCAPSWSLLSEDVDMEVEGYAFLKNVTTLVKSAPMFWMPYLVLPMKTRRQSGVLFPPISFSGIHGAQLVLPYFWAINRSSDMTFGLGTFTANGLRAQWEGRYVLAPRSSGRSNLYFTRDRTFPDKTNRFSLNVAQTQELPWGFEEKIRVMEVSDNIYPFTYPLDVALDGEAFMPSLLTLSNGLPRLSFYVSAQRYRNLLNSESGGTKVQSTQFDPRTVQVLPTATVAFTDQQLWNTRIFTGLSFNITRFYRPAGPFDYDQSSVPFGSEVPDPAPPFRPGIDPIREANRFSMTPSLYTTLRPFDIFSLVPSLQYKYYYYTFQNAVPVLNRGYLVFQTDLSTQIERIYDFPNDPNIPRSKHLIRPLLTYSLIPKFSLNQGLEHPFVRQQQNSQNQPTPVYGYYFDDYDIVPYSYNRTGANYFIPQGNSLAYGFTTQWIRKRMRNRSNVSQYQTTAELTAGQAINFLELYNPIDSSQKHIFTRFFSLLNLSFDHFVSGTTYYYYPDIPAETPRHTVSTNLTYILERAVHQRVLTFERSFSVGYTYNQVNSATSNITGSTIFSLNDYIMPNANFSYSFQQSQLFGAGMGLTLQSPSRCWKISGGVAYTLGIGASLSFDMSLNITGSAFGGVTDIANAAQSSSK